MRYTPATTELNIIDEECFNDKKMQPKITPWGGRKLNQYGARK